MEPTTQFKYQVITELGRGGMADVFLAMARGPAGFHKLTVLKQLREDSAKDARILHMLLDEARLAAQLNHPNIVQTNDAGVDDAGRFFMAMEHLEGQSLARLLQRLRANQRELPVSVALRIAAEALSGLQYAHELVDFTGKRLDIVHCDLSPHNLFVTYAGQVKLLDFGLARAKSNVTQTLSGELRGKLYYMAPEQAVAQPVDRRSDIFAMGVVLWEMLTGHQLWRGQTDIAVACNLRFGEIPRLASVAPEVPRALASTCQKALAFRANERFATALEFQAALERVQDELSLRASAEDIGALVAELFSEERLAIRGLVESHVAQRDTAETASATDTLPDGRQTTPSRPAPGPILPASGRRRLYPAALAALVLAFAVGTLLKPKAVPAPSPTASKIEAGQAKQPPAVAPRPAPAPVEIRVRADNAQIFWDDLPLGSNPFRGQFARDADVHRVRAEAAGYRSKTVIVTLDRELTLDLTLERESTNATEEQPQREKRKASPAAPRAKVTTAPDRAPEAPPAFEDPWGGR